MHPRRRWVGRAVLLVILIFSVTQVAGLFLRGFAPGSTEYKILSPLADPIGTSKGVLGSLTESPLSDVVDRAMDGSDGTYGIAIKNLRTNVVYYRNEHRRFQSASLYKLWVMGTVYQQLADGKIDKNDQLHEDIAKLNNTFDIASESAEFSEGEINMTIEKAMQQMIIISHNYAALSLVKKVKLSSVATFMKQNGLTDSNVGSPPRTTAYDIMRYYEKLYNGKMVSKQASTEMIELLKKQQLNDRIPKYLPEETEVAHKTGELEAYKHDAGIVYTPEGDFIIVMLSETSSQAIASEQEARLARRVYDYFQR